MPGICFRCKEFVHQAEERLALGSSWHLECFTCAICNTTLDSTTMSESSKGKEIYCRKCYQKNYCIPGYGYGPTKPTLVSVTPAIDCGSSVEDGSASYPCCTCGQAATVPEQRPFVQPPSRQGQQYTPRHPPVRHYTKQVVLPKACPCCKCEKDPGGPSPRVQTYNLSRLPQNQDSWKQGQGQRKSSFVRCTDAQNPGPPMNPQLDRQGQRGQCVVCCQSPPEPQQQNSQGCNCSPNISKSRRRSPIRPKTAPAEGVAICPKCGLNVFFAERVMGYRGVYHVRCYICQNCGKSLDSTTVNEHQGELYCKGCYKHKYGTVGVGYGIGAGTLQTP